jgi:hypothetical protein
MLMHRRVLLLGTLLAGLYSATAWADAAISGQWRTDLGHDVLINMDILADGHWFSQTIQNDKVVAEMAGTYVQTPTDDANGTIVFTPVKAKVTAEHGEAKVETDTYALTDDGKTLTLTIQGQEKEPMKFTNTTKED